MITLRTVSTTPPELRDAAIKAWYIAAKVLNEMLGQIAESLELPVDAFAQFCTPCSELGEERTATMLRIFRYESEKENTVVALPHRDLGLLSLVYGESPGLEVWNGASRLYWPIE